MSQWIQFRHAYLCITIKLIVPIQSADNRKLQIPALPQTIKLYLFYILRDTIRILFIFRFDFIIELFH